MISTRRSIQRHVVVCWRQSKQKFEDLSAFPAGNDDDAVYKLPIVPKSCRPDIRESPFADP